MEDKPVHIDIERMEKMLAGPRFMVPNGLTPQQIVEFMNTMAKAAEYERERCAELAKSFATCGCNGAHGRCTADDVPLAIAAAIRKGA